MFRIKIAIFFFIVVNLNLSAQDELKLIKEKSLTQIVENTTFHFRLEKTGQVLDVWSDDFRTFHSHITSYYWTINKKGKIKKYYKTVKEFNNTEAKQIYNLINNFSINTLSPDENLEIGITDEEVYSFNITKKGIKNSLKFSDIDHQKDVEQFKLIKSFLNQLNEIVNWKENYFNLAKLLPVGEYYNGSMFKLIRK